jgi:hypothetical protein
MSAEAVPRWSLATLVTSIVAKYEADRSPEAAPRPHNGSPASPAAGSSNAAAAAPADEGDRFTTVAAAEAALESLVDLDVIPENIEDDFGGMWPANRELAKQHCRFGRCVKKTLNSDGELVAVETIRVWNLWQHKELGLYGCNVAVRLLLTFQLECVLVLVVQFLLAVPQLLDNWRRNAMRDECRAELRGSTAAGASDTAGIAAACGYGGAHVRMSPPLRSLYLTATLGACEEYSNATDLNQPTFNQPYPFVRVEAAYCLSGSGMETLSWWLCAFGGTCVFLLFLLRLLRLQTVIVRSHDRQLWTVSDYAVLIEGLEKGKEADAQEALLRADLRRVADISDDDISHIEIGCGCSREARLLQRIAQLRVASQELHLRSQLDERKRHLFESTKAELKAARADLDALRGDDEGHVTTGQAFVVFQLEQTRNDVIRL